MNLSRALCTVACVLFLIGAVGRLFGVTAESNVVLFWGLAFFAAGHVL